MSRRGLSYRWCLRPRCAPTSRRPLTAAADTEIAAACDWTGLLPPDAKNTRALTCRQLHLRNCRVVEGIFAALLHVREAVCCDGVGAMSPSLKHFVVKLASLALKVLALCVVRDHRDGGGVGVAARQRARHHHHQRLRAVVRAVRGGSGAVTPCSDCVSGAFLG